MIDIPLVHTRLHEFWGCGDWEGVPSPVRDSESVVPHMIPTFLRLIGQYPPRPIDRQAFLTSDILALFGASRLEQMSACPASTTVRKCLPITML